MGFKEDLFDVFISFLTNAEYRTWFTACLLVFIVGFWFLALALTYPTQVYSGGFY